jgi:AmiR/NasT family two-component response regulator
MSSDGLRDTGPSELDLQVALERLLAVTTASFETRAQLQRALDSRVVIEQAKGILSERLRLSLTDAFAVLRQAARSKQMPLRELARRVIDERATPVEILTALQAALERGRVSTR